MLDGWHALAGLVGIGVGALLARRIGGRAPVPSAGPVPPEPVQALPVEEPAAPADQAPEAADVPLPVLLGQLGQALEPLGDRSAHPHEMPGWDAFAAAVDAFRRPDATIEVLGQYALGAHWTLACAAFEALGEHPERESLRAPVLAQIGHLRPWVIYFALGYLLRLEPRPPVGAPFVVAQPWWPDNLVIPGLLRDYLAARALDGDPPEFGDMLGAPFRESSPQIAAILRRTDHPDAAVLLQRLQEWEAGRLDRDFLLSIGRLWDMTEDADLLVEPPSWREPLEQARRAALQAPPRPVVVAGDAGVGKTSFLRLLAARLADAGWRVFEASAAELMAGQIHIGELEGRIRRLVAELDVRKRVAWYIPDLLQAAESGAYRGQTATILDQVVPAIAAGRLVLLGEASSAGITRIVERRPALRSLFEICRLEPMPEAETAALARAVADRLAARLGVTVTPPALDVALQLAPAHLGAGAAPGATLEMIGRAAARTVAAGESTVGPDAVLDTLAQITGLPRGILDDQERIDLGAVRGFFAARVMGQDEAVGAMVDRIAMLKAGLVDPGRPIGVFLFAGPTGTGKTELAKTLALYLFGSTDRMARLDMSELQTPDSVSKILGERDPAASGDALVERVRKQPFSVVLLDEFEKAHPNVWDLFLQIFDDGRLTDAAGRTVDFRHAIIVLTSNLGATAHRGAGVGFLPDQGVYADANVLRAVEQAFRPEFVNRIDRIIVFKPLSRSLMRGILLKELGALLERRGLRRRDWAVEWEASAIEFLLDRGFSAEMGARPLKRAIDQYLLAPLAATLVERRFPVGDQFLFVRSDGRALEVEFVDPDAEPTGPDMAETPIEAGDESAGLPPLAPLVLRPTGSAAEHALLASSWDGIRARIDGDDWAAGRDGLYAEAADPGFWTREDRHAVLGRIALIDRVREATATAERLLQRLSARGARAGHASRELVGRIALQLHLLQHGIDDVRDGAPPDALVTIEPALDAGVDAAAATGWSERIAAMYRGWAVRRRMQVATVAPPRPGVGPILQIGGFGAWRTLAREAGLHVLDDGDGESRRLVARVRVAAGPWQEPRPADAWQRFADRLAAAPDANGIVRRYRTEPAPLVRDARSGARTGRLAAVLEGDFDLLLATGG